jgi:hypothetical protein
MKGTDTAVSMLGPVEAHRALLAGLGVPTDEAREMVRSLVERDGAYRPGLLAVLGYRACQRCVDRAGANLTLGVVPDIPLVLPAGIEGQCVTFEIVTVDTFGEMRRKAGHDGPNVEDDTLVACGFLDDGQAWTMPCHPSAAETLRDLAERGERVSMNLARAYVD